MRRLITFGTRLLVFAMLAYIQVRMNEHNEAIQNLDFRILINACQVCLFGVVLWVYMSCKWIFDIMHSTGHYNNMYQDTTFENNSVHFDSASQVSRGMIAHQVVIFANRTDLSNHVMRVYAVGMLVYATVYCFNYTVGFVFFHASTGFVLGYIIYVFMSKTKTSTINTLYCSALTILTVMTYVQLIITEIQENSYRDLKDVIVWILSPVVVGLLWISGWCFGDENKYCLSMAWEAFPVVSLCVLPIIWATPYEYLQGIFAQFDGVMYVYVLIFEPISKFVAIYVMMISLQTQNALDIVISVCGVAHGQLYVPSNQEVMLGSISTLSTIVVVSIVVLRAVQYMYTDLHYMTFKNSTNPSSNNFEDGDFSEHEMAPTSLNQLPGV
jgi:hypothetical protein